MVGLSQMVLERTFHKDLAIDHKVGLVGYGVGDGERGGETVG